MKMRQPYLTKYRKGKTFHGTARAVKPKPDSLPEQSTDTHTHTHVSSLMEATVPCVADGMQADMNDDRLLIEDTQLR